MLLQQGDDFCRFDMRKNSLNLTSISIDLIVCRTRSAAAAYFGSRIGSGSGLNLGSEE
jgi:hypothetical protein